MSPILSLNGPSDQSGTIQAAEYAGVSRDTIYTACERREILHARIGGRRAIR
jgi:excisionase family DNA binding protein